jgi:hypothetical protein
MAMAMANGIIFNSVTKFVLQPEKTKHEVKRNTLDQLSEVWVGPAGGEDSFIPRNGTKHPDYNLMTLIDARTKQMPGLVVEVTLTYHGKMANSGTSSYSSVPTISRHWAEGEVSYQVGSMTIARRYTGRCVVFSFITNRVPNGNPSNWGMAKEFLGFQNVWEQVTNQGLPLLPGATVTTQKPPIQQMACTDVRTEDTADSWYKVTETYQSRMFPGETIVTVLPQAPVFLGFKPLFGSDNIDGTPQTTKTAKEAANQTSGAVQAAAQGQGISVPVTPSSGESADTFYATGLNTDWAGFSTQSQESSTGTLEAGKIPDLITTAQSTAATPDPPPEVNLGWYSNDASMGAPPQLLRF